MVRLISFISLILVSTLLLCSCATVPAGNPETGYAIHGFVGNNPQSSAPGVSVLLLNGTNGKAIASDKTDFFGKYAFQGLMPGHYQLKVGAFVLDVMVGAENVRQDIDLSSSTGSMDYLASGIQELQGQLTAAASGKTAPARPNHTQLAQQMAGTWWGYSGSTETKIGLCPDGSYSNFSEFGYSGTMSDSGGNQTGAWGGAGQNGGQGSWAIQGTSQSGTISVRYNDGSTETISYELANDDGCYSFDGRLLCRTSGQCE